MFAATNIRMELADKVRAIGVGGIGLVHQLAREVGLVDAIDRRLHLLKIHRPYHESDHVLNLAYNALCDGTRLEDIELAPQRRGLPRRPGHASGFPTRPPPATSAAAFDEASIRSLMQAVDEARLERLGAAARRSSSTGRRSTWTARLVVTTGECKAGMDISYNGTWGYHPLLVSLAKTGEVLRLSTAPGNRPSRTKGLPRRPTRPLPCVVGPAFARSCFAATRPSARPSSSTAGTATE